MTDAMPRAPAHSDERMQAGEAPPTLLVIGTTPEFSHLLASLCTALGVELIEVDAVSLLTAALHRIRPIGIAAGLAGTGATMPCHVVKAVGRYSVTLPTLLCTDDDPETLGCLDAIAALCGLTELHRLSVPPRAEDVLAFIARAGRQSGSLRLMPV
jgi:hypothetical protein